LSHILREVRVAVDLTERGRIDQIDMPADEFGKGVLGICRGVALEQFAIGCHIRIIEPARNESAQNFAGSSAKVIARTIFSAITHRACII
jgi:hypothetical protein